MAVYFQSEVSFCIPQGTLLLQPNFVGLSRELSFGDIRQMAVAYCKRSSACGSLSLG